MAVGIVELRVIERDEEERIVDNRDIGEAGEKHSVASPRESLPTFAINKNSLGMRAPD